MKGWQAADLVYRTRGIKAPAKTVLAHMAFRSGEAGEDQLYQGDADTIAAESGHSRSVVYDAINKLLKDLFITRQTTACYTVNIGKIGSLVPSEIRTEPSGIRTGTRPKYGLPVRDTDGLTPYNDFKTTKHSGNKKRQMDYSDWLPQPAPIEAPSPARRSSAGDTPITAAAAAPAAPDQNVVPATRLQERREAKRRGTPPLAQLGFEDIRATC